MFYVERAADGTIIALHNAPTPSAKEQKPLTDAEVITFLSNSESWKNLLAVSDFATIRILEDLIDLLVSKNIINFTELPIQAQERILERKQLREHIDQSSSLLVKDIL
jgi:hypothetical protein